MGIRLYFRKKGIESEEFCLGKLYGYLNSGKDAETLNSICFLVDTGTIANLVNEYKEDMAEPEKTLMSDHETFEEYCYVCPYQDYGDFFQMTKAKCREFIKLYLQDHARVWGHEYWYNTEQCALDFMQRMSSSEKSIFEFRLGA